MKTNLLFPDPKDLTLVDVIQKFDTDDKARGYLENIRWPKGVTCPHCKSADGVWKLEANPAKNIRPGLYRCGACLKQFTVTVGTIFEDSHIPLSKWLIAWYLFCSSKKGVSSLQIQRMLKLGSYRTALFMMHRIRYAVQHPFFTDKLDGTVEVDETYVGGKVKGMGRHYTGNKTPVVSLVQRDGKARSRVMACVTGNNLKAVIQDNVVEGSKLYTDQFRPYRRAAKGFKHGKVNHSAGEYVRGDVHTNTVEGYFSLLKRGIVGTFHSVSKQHLPLYLAEFDHRYNTRKMTDGERTVDGLQQMEGKRLLYKVRQKA
jgi:transposase-like protein